MNFDIVIPTYKRRAKLERCLNSIIKSNNLKNINTVVYYDNFPTITGEDVVDIDKISAEKYGIKFLGLKEQHRAFGVWNNHLKNLNSDGMFYICDDTELHPNCLEKALECLLRNFPDTDGVVGINQENINKGNEGYSVSAMGLIGKKFADRYPDRKCFCTDYISLHADAELGVYARSVGKFNFCPEAKLFHWHPSHYKNEMDETHNIVRGNNKIIDKETWNMRQEKKLLWGRSFEKVR